MALEHNIGIDLGGTKIECIVLENQKENGNRNATFQQKCVRSIDEKLCDLFSVRRLQ